MGSRIHFPLLPYLSIFILLCCVVEQSTTFTIELLNRYALESPFYSTNLTDQELIERMHFSKETYEQQVSLNNSSVEENGTLIDLETIRPSLDFDIRLSAFLVKVSLGTFTDGRPSYKSYYLDFDTGSDIIWLQCEDCMKENNHCYRQIEPPFPNSMSSSYRPLPCDRHPLCYPHQCIENSCSYYIEYVDDSHSYGILARENFAFPSTTGQEEIVPIVFGCGIHNKRSYGKDRDLKMAGIFGMGWGRRSFVTQINSVSQGRFAYCFPPASNAAQGLSTFLRFGSDIPSYSDLQKTRLIKYQDDDGYYVNLLGISINGVRLSIPSIYFQKGGSGVGGCYFDTGYTGTSISTLAFQIVKKAVERHITNSIKRLKMAGPMFKFDLCYRSSKPFREYNKLPSITFHFEGNADLVVKPETLFYHNSRNFYHDYICLAITSGESTIIGSTTQENQFIVYDLHEHSIYFGARDCSRNP